MKSAVLVLAWCCACLGGKPPRYDYFVLTPTVAPASTSGMRDQPTRPTVAVSQVTIPRYLDRESIVTRADDYRVVYSKQERWAEPLDEAVTRILREDLAATLAPAGFTLPSRTAAPTYDLQVEILRFERRGDQVELWARWTMRASEGAAHTHETRIQIPVAGPAGSAAAAALSQAVARLATEIAAQVRIAAADRHEPHGSG